MASLGCRRGSISNISKPWCTLYTDRAKIDHGVGLVSHAIDFIETSTFTRSFREIATDDELRILQNELIAQPDKGEIIQGTGGVRKIRIATGAKGKSGGGRVLYFLLRPEKIHLLLAYPKSSKESITDEEKLVLKGLVKQLKGE